MAIFKNYSGSREELNSTPKQEGAVYFLDDGSMHFDYIDKNNELSRSELIVQERMESYVNEAIANINPSDIDLSNYPTKDEAVLKSSNLIEGQIVFGQTPQGQKTYGLRTKVPYASSYIDLDEPNLEGGIPLYNTNGSFPLLVRSEYIEDWENFGNGETTQIMLEPDTYDAINRYWAEKTFAQKGDFPVAAGEGNNSIIHSNTDAQAISENAIAEQGCVAGLRGYVFYYGNQSTGIAPGKTGYVAPSGNESDFSSSDTIMLWCKGVDYPEIVGKKISIINGSKYINCGTVIDYSWFDNTSSEDNSYSITVELDQAAMTQWSWNNYVKEPRPENGTDECTFFCLDYPEIGDVDLGKNSRASGIGAKALAAGAFATGRDTIAQSQYSSAFGRGSKANYACMAINRDCQALGDNSFAGGNKSIAKHLTSMAWGNNVKTGDIYQVALGKFNVETKGAAFVVGNGSTSAPSNGLVVWNDGRVSSGSINATADTDLTPKKWVENKISPLNTSITSIQGELSPIKTRLKNVEDSKATNNTTLSSSVALGNSTTNSQETLTFGSLSKVEIPDGPDKYYGIALGKDNVVRGQYSVAIGYGLRTAEWESSSKQNRDQIVLGGYNEVIEASPTFGNVNKTGARLIVGNGKSDTARSNAFVVWNDGRASIFKDPTESMDVVPKHMYDELKERLDAYDSLESDEWIEIANIYANSTAGSGFSSGTASFPSGVFSTKIRKFKLVRHNYDATTGEYKETNSADYFTGILNRSQVIIYGTLEHSNSCSPIYISVKYANGPYSVDIYNLDGTAAKPYDNSGRYKYVLHVSK